MCGGPENSLAALFAEHDEAVKLRVQENSGRGCYVCARSARAAHPLLIMTALSRLADVRARTHRLRRVRCWQERLPRQWLRWSPKKPRKRRKPCRRTASERDRKS